MSVKELFGHIGKSGLLPLDGIQIKVMVKDVKTSYGVERFLIAPEAGSGEVWVNAERVSLSA
jgi:hypothetical protein